MELNAPGLYTFHPEIAIGSPPVTAEKAQVVDIFGQTVPGLYAAGEIIGGVHGAAYMTGTAFGKALIFGRIAAKSVLTQK